MLHKLENSSDSKSLITTLQNISEQANITIENLRSSKELSHIEEICKITSRIYSKAAEMIKHDQKFEDLSSYSKVLLSNAEYWKKKSETILMDTTYSLQNQSLESSNSGDFYTSLEYLDKAVKIDPENAKLWVDRGNLLFSAGRFVESIQCYDKAMDYDPKDHLSPYNKALALTEINQLNESLIWFDNAIKKNNKMEAALLTKGDVLQRLGKYDEANIEFDKVLNFNPQSTEALLGKYNIFFDRSNYQKAAEYAKRILEIKPDMAVAEANLAECLLYSDDEYETSKRLAENVIQNNPEQYDYPMKLVKMCLAYSQNDNENAAEQAIDLLEYHKSIYKHRFLDWNYSGLKNIIENKENLSRQIKDVIFDFIFLAESGNEAKKIKIINELPKKIKKTSESHHLLNIPNPLQKYKKKPNIRIENTSKPIKESPGWYEWEINLSSDSDLDSVKSVTYYLHETFPNRKQTISNRETGFKLESSGWGEFQIKAKIEFKDGKKQTKYHWLELGETPLDPEK